MATVIGTDYTRRKKDVLVVRLGDEDDPLELRILPPTKGIYDAMVTVAGYVDQAASGTLDYESFDMSDVLELVARAMSNNSDMRVITPDYLESVRFDMSDIGDFVGLYTFFLTELVKGKN